MPVLSPCVRRPDVENIPPGQMEPEYPSPSTSRQMSVFSPLTNNTGGLEQGNDDAAELKARRRSRVLEIQRQRLASSPLHEADRSKSTPLSSLTSAQVAEHYRNCIKLSAENKINAKNAFGLHLIDYMSELIKKKELNNFQVASSTLDASAKIYAGRVDAIHSDMFKVLGGLGQQTKTGSGDEADEPGVDSPKKSPSADEKRRKRKKTTKKIKACVKAITMDSYNLEFEVDPLFKKTSATFDEGGTNGLLVNNLSCGDNLSQLVLDSQVDVISLSQGSPCKRRDLRCPVNELKGVLPQARVAQVSPAFSDFTFSNWSSENEGLFESLLNPGPEQGHHVFDPEAEPEPIPDFLPENDLVNDDVVADSDNESTTSDRVPVLNVDKEAQLVNTVMESIKHGDIGELMHVLTSEQNDYSHFSASVLNTWAGPSLWKMKAGALIKNKLGAVANDVEGTDKAKRKRKEPFKIDLEKEVNFASLLKESRAATTVKEERLNEYTKSKTTLPADLRVEADQIFKRELKDGLMLRRKRSSTDVEDGVGQYDYDNVNDANNFCTAVTDEDDDDDGSHPMMDSQDSVTNEFQVTDDGADRTVFNQETMMDMTAGGTMAMVEQPRKLQKLQIDYARTAKKIDVKKLKSSMWQILSKSDDKKTAPDANQPSVSNLEGEVQFSDLVKKLPEKVSENMAKNLSTPVCFVCFLHLVNEKNLSVEGTEDMSDFTIKQG